jgi:hypothetical protein
MQSKLEIYNELYEEASELMKQYDPCRIKDGKCIRGRFCCDGCKYLSPNGCTTKALVCRIWLCEKAKSKAPEELLLKLEDISTRLWHHNVGNSRGNINDIMK